MATQRKETWTALYLPAGQKRKSKFDLPSLAAAQQYVFDNMCETCKKERATALRMKGASRGTIEDDMCELFPGCYYEWAILKTKDLKKSESHEDIMEAAGWKTIYNVRS